MNKKLTPFDAIAELDSISISVEQISDMFKKADPQVGSAFVIPQYTP